jgi:hypothetical protein
MNDTDQSKSRENVLRKPRLKRGFFCCPKDPAASGVAKPLI